MHEKRRHPRVPLSRRCDVIDQNTARTIGRIVNLSRGGLMLMSEAPVPINGVFQVDVVCEHGNKAVDTFSVGVECLWCGPANDPAVHVAGFQIIDASDQALSALDALLSAESP